MCSAPLQIRLADGEEPNAGRVEVRYGLCWLSDGYFNTELFDHSFMSVLVTVFLEVATYLG